MDNGQVLFVAKDAALLGLTAHARIWVSPDREVLGLRPLNFTYLFGKVTQILLLRPSLPALAYSHTL